MAKRKKVLVVDDSPAVVDSLTGALEDAGYEVGSATDGEEVFRKMAALDPDALLLDVYMPKINGADVCRLIKAHPHWKKTWLVIISARISDSEIDMYKRIGANDILKKPFDPQVAVQAVAKGIGAGEPSPF
jgi:twitching motility two-component system response regulator PilG/twitching motility two-component system response regulator PilH